MPSIWLRCVTISPRASGESEVAGDEDGFCVGQSGAGDWLEAGGGGCHRVCRAGAGGMGDYFAGEEVKVFPLFGLGFRLAGVSLSFASPKESKQRKGDPWVGAGLRPVPCATRQAGRLAKLACGSNNASRRPPASLRCSAPLKGPGKTSVAEQWLSFFGIFQGRPQQPIFLFASCAAPPFGSPCGAPSNAGAGGKRARTV